jgi:hypothetical protein
MAARASCLAEGLFLGEWPDPPLPGATWPDFVEALARHPNVRAMHASPGLSRVLCQDGSVLTRDQVGMRWQPPGSACEVCGAPATMVVQDARKVVAGDGWDAPEFHPDGQPVLRCPDHPRIPVVRLVWG